VAGVLVQSDYNSSRLGTAPMMNDEELQLFSKHELYVEHKISPWLISMMRSGPFEATSFLSKYAYCTSEPAQNPELT
jgi:hypothetical protein